MEHFPFRDWILEDEALSLEQMRELEAHLTICEECAALKNGWGTVKNLFASPSFVVPAPGFVSRWEAEVALRKAREQKVMAGRMFLFIACAELVTLFLFIGVILAQYSPVELLAGTMQFITRILIQLGSIGDAVNAVYHVLPPAVSVLFWILATTSFSVLALIWCGSLLRLQLKGANQR